MSLSHIKQLINNKYNEVYDINNININKSKTDINVSTEMEWFIYDLLEKYDKNKVMYFIKELFDIEFKYEDSLKLQVCRNDYEFRKAVKDKYKNCIICDKNSECDESVYDVAHIFDFSKCETELEKYDVNNGIILCANMHKRFDKSLLKFVIDSVYDDIYLVKIVFCEKLCDYMFYKKYNGKQLQFTKENIMYIEKKNNIV
jgi:predicted restriction endonuclease